MTDSERIKEIRERCEKAPEGPWAWYAYGEKCYAFGVITVADKRHRLVGGRIENDQMVSLDNPDAELVFIDNICECEEQYGDVVCQFISHARSDIPWLLEQLEQARRAFEETNK